MYDRLIDIILSILLLFIAFRLLALSELLGTLMDVSVLISQLGSSPMPSLEVISNGVISLHSDPVW